MNLTSQLVCIVCKIKSSLFTSVIIVKVLYPGKVGMLMDCFVTSQMFNDTCLFVDGFFDLISCEESLGNRFVKEFKFVILCGPGHCTRSISKILCISIS